jgi:hypothetical protein
MLPDSVAGPVEARATATAAVVRPSHDRRRRPSTCAALCCAATSARRTGLSSLARRNQRGLSAPSAAITSSATETPSRGRELASSSTTR